MITKNRLENEIKINENLIKDEEKEIDKLIKKFVNNNISAEKFNKEVDYIKEKIDILKKGILAYKYLINIYFQ